MVGLCVEERRAEAGGRGVILPWRSQASTRKGTLVHGIHEHQNLLPTSARSLIMLPTPEEETVLRPLGLHERYCLARANTGYPACICIVARIDLAEHLSDAHDAPLWTQFLDRTRPRIERACTLYPLLRCGITDARTPIPRWRLLLPLPKPDDVLEVGSALPPDDQRDDEAVAATLLSQQHTSWRELGRATDPDQQNPLWHVTLTPCTSTEPKHVWISLLCDHTISDGMGLLRLFELLFSSNIHELDQGPADTAPSSGPVLPPPSDAVYDMVPSKLALPGIIWTKMVWPQLAPRLASLVPYLPGSGWPLISSKSTIQRQWPSSSDMNPALESLLTAPPTVRTILLPNTLTRLKKLAAQHEIRGIHTLLHTAAIVALYTLVYPLDDGNQDESERFKVQTATPMSVRGRPASEPVPYATGNYVGTVEWNGTIGSDDSVWELTKSFGEYLTRPDAATEGLQNVGMLALLSNTPPEPRDGEKAVSTGWEAYIRGKHLRPPDTAMELSNLGKLSTSLSSSNGQASAVRPVVHGVRAFAWAQAVQPSGAGLTIDLCGYEDTLSTSIGLRAGRFAPDQQDRIQRLFASVFKGIIATLLQPQPASVPDLSVRELNALSWTAINKPSLAMNELERPTKR